MTPEEIKINNLSRELEYLAKQQDLLSREAAACSNKQTQIIAQIQATTLRISQKKAEIENLKSNSKKLLLENKKIQTQIEDLEEINQYMEGLLIDVKEVSYDPYEAELLALIQDKI